MKPAVRTWCRRIGTAVAVVGVAYVALRFLRYGHELAPTQVPGVVWLCAVGLAGGYAAANLLLALAWRTLLEMQGQHRTRVWSIRIQGLSQLAKYIPGNVMHFVSRQLLAAADGVPHAVVARSALYELAGLASAGVLLSLWALPLIDARLFPWVTPLTGTTAVLLVLAGVVLVAGRPTARVLALYLLFLLVAAFAFTALLALLVPDGAPILPWQAVCGAYTAAWLAGFVVPGAPAGLGVREMVLALLLDGHVADRDLLPAVLLSRVITVLGDTLFFGAAAWTGRRSGSAAPVAGARQP